MNYIILTFNSTHHVLLAEKLLNNKGITHDIIPTPKDISSDCGVSIRMKANDNNIQTISNVLRSQNLRFKLTRKEI